MSEQVMITLNKIPKCILGMRKFNKLVKEHGGKDAEWDKPFPLSTILDSYGLMEALLCMTALPEYKSLVVDFVFFCAGRVAKDPRTVKKQKIIKNVNGFYKDKCGALELCQFDYINEKAFYSGEDALYNVKISGNILVSSSTYRQIAREVTINTIINYEEEKQKDYFRILLNGVTGVG